MSRSCPTYARARTSGDSQFAGFTFDHEMNGIIVGEQGDTRELFLLRVEANEVTRKSSAEVTRFCRGSPDTGSRRSALAGRRETMAVKLGLPAARTRADTAAAVASSTPQEDEGII